MPLIIPKVGAGCASLLPRLQVLGDATARLSTPGQPEVEEHAEDAA